MFSCTKATFDKHVITKDLSSCNMIRWYFSFFASFIILSHNRKLVAFSARLLASTCLRRFSFFVELSTNNLSLSNKLYLASSSSSWDFFNSNSLIDTLPSSNANEMLGLAIDILSTFSFKALI
jgi:hypothetical protein